MHCEGISVLWNAFQSIALVMAVMLSHSWVPFESWFQHDPFHGKNSVSKLVEGASGHIKLISLSLPIMLFCNPPNGLINPWLTNLSNKAFISIHLFHMIGLVDAELP